MFFSHKNASNKYKTYKENKKWKRVRQIGFDSIKRQPIYDELTYEYFVDHIGEEWIFDYPVLGKTISISSGNHYELSIMDWKNNSWIFQYYETKEQLLNDTIVMGKSIEEFWDELEN